MTKFILKVAVFVSVIFAFQSCSSLSSLFQSPENREAFRYGWNQTAPEEWRFQY